MATIAPLSGATGRAATITIAANGATAAEKAQADYVCDLTDDYVELAAAIAALPASGGKIVMLGPVFDMGDTPVDIEGSANGTDFRSVWIECPGIIQTASAISIFRLGNTKESHYFKGRFGNIIYTGTERAVGSKAFELIRSTYADIEFKRLELFEYGIHLNVTSGVDANGNNGGGHNRFAGFVRYCKYNYYLQGDGAPNANNAEMSLLEGPWSVQITSVTNPSVDNIHIGANARNTKIYIDEIDTFQAGAHAIVDESGYNEIRTTYIEDQGGVADAQRLGIDAIEGAGKSTDTVHITNYQENYAPNLNLSNGPITFDDGTQQTRAYYTSTASDNLKNSNDTEKSTAALTYTKIKEIVLTDALPGVRLKFDLKTAGGGATATARAYKNGVAIGTEQTDVTGGYVTKSEDFTAWVVGDLIQIYAYTSDVAQAAYVCNMRLYYDVAADTSALGATAQDP